VRPDLCGERLEAGSRELSLDARELQLARSRALIIEDTLSDRDDRRVDQQRDVEVHRAPEHSLSKQHGHAVEHPRAQPVAEHDEHVRDEGEDGNCHHVRDDVPLPLRAGQRKPAGQRDGGQRHRDPRKSLGERRADRTPERDWIDPAQDRPHRRLRAPDEPEEHPRETDPNDDTPAEHVRVSVGGGSRGGHAAKVRLGRGGGERLALQNVEMDAKA
jgi:hypothetical protein